MLFAKVMRPLTALFRSKCSAPEIVSDTQELQGVCCKQSKSAIESLHSYQAQVEKNASVQNNTISDLLNVTSHCLLLRSLLKFSVSRGL